MAKLYPPVIEGTIPAFNGTTLVVPFSMNRSVSESQISHFALKVKTIQSNTYIATLTNGVLSSDGSSAIFTLVREGENLCWLPSTVDASYPITPGQFYKVQLAYINNNEVGYFSTVGVIKYVHIQSSAVQLLCGSVNMSAAPNMLYSFKHTYTGTYTYSNDPMEKIYTYRFVIYDEHDNIIQDSGDLLHNATQDDINTSTDTYTFIDDLVDNATFYLQYSIVTVNGLRLSSAKIGVFAAAEYTVDLDISLVATNNFDNGYVNLKLQNNTDKAFSGKFRIYRQNVDYPLRWEPIFSFVVQGDALETALVWKDFTVEHGKTYKYRLCQFNDNDILATITYSEPIYVDFEDMFLYDGKRQLKVRFNPKVSSFKNDILESKLDTIGSKYPFFFRNGVVHYKEFPISGLISYWADNEELFIPLQTIGIDTGDEVRISTPYRQQLPENMKTTNLVNYNIAAERQFKLEVLEWLTNGQPKLFRSPAEGNYIVRLLNTSLAPTDSVGRMLHTFSCTAYEIDECTYKNLENYGFVTGLVVTNDATQLQFRTVELDYILNQNSLLGTNSPYTPDDNGFIELLVNPYNNYMPSVARSVYIYDCEYSDLGDTFYINSQPVKIGATQNYSLEYPLEITSIKFKPSEVHSKHTAKITYSYYTTFVGTNDFDQIADITMGVMPIQQFGNGITADIDSSVNLIDKIQDPRTTVTQYIYLKLEKRPIAILYSDNSPEGWTTIDRSTLNLHCSFTNVKLTENQDIITAVSKMPFYIFKIVPSQQLETTATSLSTWVTEYQYQPTQDTTWVPYKHYYLPLYTYIDDNEDNIAIYSEIDTNTWEGSMSDLYEQIPVYNDMESVTQPIYTPVYVNKWDYEDEEDIWYIYYDINTKTIKKLVYNDSFTCAYINTEAVDEPDWEDPTHCIDLLYSSQPAIYHDLDLLQSLYIGDGLIATVGYQYARRTYQSDNQGAIYIRRQQYEKGLAQYLTAVKNYTIDQPDPLDQLATITIVGTDIDTTGYTWREWLKEVKKWYLEALDNSIILIDESTESEELPEEEPEEEIIDEP